MEIDCVGAAPFPQFNAWQLKRGSRNETGEIDKRIDSVGSSRFGRGTEKQRKLCGFECGNFLLEGMHSLRHRSV